MGSHRPVGPRSPDSARCRSIREEDHSSSSLVHRRRPPTIVAPIFNSDDEIQSTITIEIDITPLVYAAIAALGLSPPAVYGIGDRSAVSSSFRYRFWRSRDTLPPATTRATDHRHSSASHRVHRFAELPARRKDGILSDASSTPEFSKSHTPLEGLSGQDTIKSKSPSPSASQGIGQAQRPTPSRPPSRMMIRKRFEAIRAKGFQPKGAHPRMIRMALTISCFFMTNTCPFA